MRASQAGRSRLIGCPLGLTRSATLPSCSAAALGVRRGGRSRWSRRRRSSGSASWSAGRSAISLDRMMSSTRGCDLEVTQAVTRALRALRPRSTQAQTDLERRLAVAVPEPPASFSFTAARASPTSPHPTTLRQSRAWRCRSRRDPAAPRCSRSRAQASGKPVHIHVHHARSPSNRPRSRAMAGYDTRNHNPEFGGSRPPPPVWLPPRKRDRRAWSSHVRPPAAAARKRPHHADFPLACRGVGSTADG